MLICVTERTKGQKGRKSEREVTFIDQRIDDIGLCWRSAFSGVCAAFCYSEVTVIDKVVQDRLNIVRLFK